MSKAELPPLTDNEAKVAFARLLQFDHVVLAVSGGPDSIALMVLAAEWRSRQQHAPVISVATVDHGLRAESRSEAEMVAEAAARLDLPHVILTWEGAKPSAGVPEAARDARYRLLENYVRAIAQNARVAIVTAHHQDDQAETVLMRLARGAGIDGLSGMREEHPLRDGSSVVLVRPLLAIPKARLIATLSARGIPSVDDPTNADLRFERPRLRSRLGHFEAAGVTPPALATSARRLNDAREALGYAEDHFVTTLGLTYGNEIFAKLDRRAFESGPTFLRQRVLKRLIDRFGGDSLRPQLSEIEDLVARMQRDGASAATLGGTMISTGARFIRVWREVGRIDTGEVALLPGEMHIWDRRFALRWSMQTNKQADQPCPNAVSVKPLGEKGYAAIVSRLAHTHRPPARAARALPAFWAGEVVIAAPSLAPFALSDAPPLDPAGFELTPLAASA